MRCPACDSDLAFEPWVQESASFEICPSCGIQFGYNDARPDVRGGVYREWRRAWIANGRRPFSGEAWRRVSKEVMALITAEGNTS
jgi:hypothetical protein